MDGFLRRVGVGLGTLEILLPRTDFEAGEEVEGHIHYRLSQATEARGLFVRLSARRQILERHRYNDQERYRTEEVYSKDFPVTGPQLYSGGTQAFTIPLPEGYYGPAVSDPPSLASAVMDAVMNLAFQRQGPDPQALPSRPTVSGPEEFEWDKVETCHVTWKLSAWLDIPWSLDLKGEQELRVFPATRSYPQRAQVPPAFSPAPRPEAQAPAPRPAPRLEAQPPAPRPAVGPEGPHPVPTAQAARKRPSFCGSCGQRYGPDDEFCEKCGQARRK